jgi:hypothetical protein
MNAQALILPLVLAFVHCFTAPGLVHFTTWPCWACLIV